MEFYYHGVEEDVLVVSADGGLNRAVSQRFVEEVESMVDSGLRKIVVDCAQLTYISSFGLGVLLQLHRRMKKHNGDVKLCNVHNVVLDVLRLTRLQTIFGIYDDLSKALAAFPTK